MPVRILRWKGGSGGDMLLHAMSLTCSVANVDYVNIADNGQALPRFDHINWQKLTSLQRIALKPQYHEAIAVASLDRELQPLIDSEHCFWVKSHFYQTSRFNDITLDIVVDALSLPFVVQSNVIKTESLALDFNAMVGRIADKHVRLQYTMFCVARDAVNQKQDLSTHTIDVSDIIVGYQHLCKSLAQHQIFLSDAAEKIYNEWLDKNQCYLPSTTYMQQLNNAQPDYSNPGLSLSEKYSLMALTGCKFQLLDRPNI